MKRLLLVLNVFLCFIAKSQNLVPNPSFEQIYSCPTAGSQFDGYVYNWFNSNAASPNLFSECAAPFPFSSVDIPLNGWGYQMARTGINYIGIVEYASWGDEGREYISAKLNSNLLAGKKYCVGYYVSVSNGDTTIPIFGSQFAIDCMGLLFSDTAVFVPTVNTLPYSPQITNPSGFFLNDTVNWMLIKSNYIANGTEAYITIGNFNNNANTDTLRINNFFHDGAAVCTSSAA